MVHRPAAHIGYGKEPVLENIHNCKVAAYRDCPMLGGGHGPEPGHALDRLELLVAR